MTAVHYFSNSTDGEQWMRRFCYRCAHDHNFHGDNGTQTDPCLHQCNLYTHEHDDTFIRTPISVAMPSGRTLETHTWDCVQFTRCSCDNGPDDPGVQRTPPPNPNQIALFDADDVPAGVPADVWHKSFPAGAQV